MNAYAELIQRNYREYVYINFKKKSILSLIKYILY